MVYYFSHHCQEIILLKQFNEREAYFDSEFQGIASHPCGKSMGLRVILSVEVRACGMVCSHVDGSGSRESLGWEVEYH